MKPLISCVIPTRNRHALARRAVRSLFQSTYPNLEVIVVDDFSDQPFSFDEVPEDFIAVKVHRLERPMGGAIARNIGIDLSSGDFLCFLDDDDEILPAKFDRMLPPLLGDSSLDAVVAECIIVDVQGGSEAVCSNPSFNVRRNAIQNRIHTNATLIRRSSLGPLRFNESLERFQDTQFNTDLCYLRNVLHIDLPVAKWYVSHGMQITARRGHFFCARNYAKLICHMVFKSKIPFPLLYKHFARLVWFSLRMQ